MDFFEDRIVAGFVYWPTKQTNSHSALSTAFWMMSPDRSPTVRAAILNKEMLAANGAHRSSWQRSSRIMIRIHREGRFLTVLILLLPRRIPRRSPEGDEEIRSHRAIKRLLLGGRVIMADGELDKIAEYDQGIEIRYPMGGGGGVPPRSRHQLRLRTYQILQNSTLDDPRRAPLEGEYGESATVPGVR
jgi:hypothetical protein